MSSSRKRKDEDTSFRIEAMQEFLDAAEVAVVLISPDRKIGYMNAVAELNWGKSTGKSCFEALQNAREACRDCPLEEVLEKKALLKREMRMAAGEGWADRENMYMHVLGPVSGSPFMAVVSTDLPERRALQREVRLERELSRALLQSVNALAIGFNAEGEVSFVNGAVERVAGLSEAEIMSAGRIELLVPGEYRELAREYFGSPPEEPRSTEAVLIPLSNRDGLRRMISWTYSPLQITDGKVEGAVALGQDVSERFARRRQAEKIAEELLVVNTILARIGGSTEVDEMLELALGTLLTLPGYRCGAAYHLEGGGYEGRLVAHKGFEKAQPMELARGSEREFPGTAVLSNKVETVALSATSMNPIIRAACEAEGLKGVTAVPLFIGGRPLGLLLLGHDLEPEDAAAGLDVLRGAADALELGAENAFWRVMAEERAKEATSLFSVAQSLTGTLDLTSALARVAAEAAALLGVDSCNIWLYDEEAGMLHAKTGHDWTPAGRLPPSVPISESRAAAEARRTLKPVIMDGARCDTRLSDAVATTGGDRSSLVVPLVTEGRFTGALALDTTAHGRGFTRRETDLMESFARQASIAIHNASLVEELRESEERYRAVAENPLVGIFVHDGADVLFANDRAFEMAGYQRGELNTIEQIVGLILPEERPGIAALIDSFLSGAEPARVRREVRIQKKDGSVAGLDIMSAIIALGTRRAFMVTMVDITQRVQAEEALRSSEERYRTLVESSRDSILIAGPRGNILFANSASVQLTGLEPDQLIGSNLYNVVHPDERREVIAAFYREWEAGRGVTRYPIRVIVNNEEKFFEATTAVLGEAGPSANTMVIVRDVTEREQAQRMVRESEERYRTIVETSRDLIVMANRAGEILYANPVVTEVFGLTPGEAIGRYLFEFVYPDDRERVANDFINDWKTGRTIPNYPLRLMDHTGKVINIETTSGLVGWPDEGTMQIFVIRDVTERKQREEERDLQLRVDEAMVAVANRFADNEDVYEAIRETLGGVGELLGLDRAFYLELSEGGANTARVVEWVSVGTEPIRDYLQGLPPDEFSWWMEGLSSGNEVSFVNAGDMPPEADLELLERFDIGAAAVVPVMVRDAVAGAMAFHSVGEPRQWSTHELHLLREIAHTVSRTIEREQWIARLGRSERFRTRITESIGEGLFVLTNGVITWANRQAADIYGYATEELLGRTPEFMFPDPADLEGMAARMLDALAGGGIFVNEEKARRKDGSLIDVVMSITSLGMTEEGAGEILAAVRDITDAKSMQEAVSAAADAYSTLFSSAADAFFVHSVEGVIRDVNERACQYTGYSRGELLQMHISNLVSERLRPLYADRRDEVLRDGMTSFEVNILKKDGSRLPVEVTSRLIRIWGEEVVLSSYRDVTERRKAEAETRRRARQLESLNEIVKAGTGSLDLKTAVEAILRAALEASGADGGAVFLETRPGRGDYAPVAVVGELPDVRELLGEDAPGDFAREVLSSLEKSEIIDVRESQASGRVAAVMGALSDRGKAQALLVPLGSGGKALGFMALAASGPDTFDERDKGFYDAVAAEIGVAIENTIIYRELAAEHERLSLLYRTAQGISGELELGALLARTAEEAARAVGARHAMVALAEPGLNSFEWRAAYNIDLADLGGATLRQDSGIGQKVIETKRALVAHPEEELEQEELELLENDSVTLVLGVMYGAAVPLVSGDQVLGVLMLYSETGDRRLSSADVLLLEAIGRQAGVAIENARLYEQARHHLEDLEKAHQELMRLDRMKSDFVSTVSHELRSPLAVIEGFAKTMVEHFDQIDRETERESLEIILKKSVALEGLIENILDMSRIEEGRLEVAREEFDLVELIERVRTDHVSLDDTHEVLSQAPDGPLLVFADREKAEVALGNLIRNAVKFSPEGGAVLISVSRAGSMAEVNVADRGIGIPEEELERVFDRFYQVDSGETRSFPGSGLGLYITRELVQSMGGNVTVKSRPGHGSVFTFSLQLAR